MSKTEIEVKKDIARRLMKSNKVLWNSLSQERRDSAVEKYYNMNSGENIGLPKILENNRNMRISLGNILVGLLLGLFGSVASNILSKYLPTGGFSDLFMIIVFIAILSWFIHMIDKTSIESLREDKVLERLNNSI